MSNDFKVNSKTQILEFKRKHNELVDNVENISSDLEEIPNVENAETGTIVENLGLNNEGKLVKSLSSAIKLYQCQLEFNCKYFKDDGSSDNKKATIIIWSTNNAEFVYNISGLRRIYVENVKTLVSGVYPNGIIINNTFTKMQNNFYVIPQKSSNYEYITISLEAHNGSSSLANYDSALVSIVSQVWTEF